jgi:hypothetical protein
MSSEVSKSEFWRSAIESWESSGLSQQAYCELHGLSYVRFTYWRGRQLKSLKPSKSSDFIPVRIHESEDSAVEKTAPLPAGMVVHLPTGGHLFLRHEREVSLVSALLKSLASSC